jgi:NitT/TauT family transport system substrate-binding protein
VFWYVKADSPIKTMDDLAGKKVGFSNRGSSTHFALLTMTDLLAAKGLPAPEGVPAGSQPDNFTAVRTDQIDAGWSGPPDFMEDVQKGTIRIVARTRDMPPLKDITVRVGVANANFLDKQGDVMRGYLAAHKKALDFIYSNPDEALDIWIRRGERTESRDVLKDTWNYYTKETLALSPIKGMDKNQQLAVDFKFLDKPLTDEQLKQLLDLRFVPS